MTTQQHAAEEAATSELASAAKEEVRVRYSFFRSLHYSGVVLLNSPLPGVALRIPLSLSVMSR